MSNLPLNSLLLQIVDKNRDTDIPALEDRIVEMVNKHQRSEIQRLEREVQYQKSLVERYQQMLKGK